MLFSRAELLKFSLSASDLWCTGLLAGISKNWIYWRLHWAASTASGRCHWSARRQPEWWLHATSVRLVF